MPVKTSDLPKSLLRPPKYGPSLGRPSVGAFPQVDRVKLARALGLSTQSVGRLLRGESVPRNDRLLHLATVLKLPVTSVRAELRSAAAKLRSKGTGSTGANGREFVRSGARTSGLSKESRHG